MHDEVKRLIEGIKQQWSWLGVGALALVGGAALEPPPHRSFFRRRAAQARGSLQAFCILYFVVSIFSTAGQQQAVRSFLDIFLNSFSRAQKSGYEKTDMKECVKK